MTRARLLVLTLALAVAPALGAAVGPVDAVAEADGDCRTARDAGKGTLAISLNAPAACLGTLAGDDLEDWYAVEVLPEHGALNVTLTPNWRSDFDLCVWRPTVAEANCSLRAKPVFDWVELDAPEVAETWAVSVHLFEGGGEYALSITAEEAAPWFRRVTGTVAATPTGSRADEASGPALERLERLCAAPTPVTPSGCLSDLDASVRDICVPGPIVSPDECAGPIVDALVEGACGVLAGRLCVTRRPTVSVSDLGTLDGALDGADDARGGQDGKWIALGSRATGIERATLAWESARSAVRMDLAWYDRDVLLGRCDTSGFEECSAPVGADRVQVLAVGPAADASDVPRTPPLGLPPPPATDATPSPAPPGSLAVPFELTLDARKRAQDDCGSGKDAGDVAAQAVPVVVGADTRVCTGFLEDDDAEDWFSVALAEGDRVSLSLTPPSDADFDLCLHGRAGERVACSILPAGATEGIHYVARDRGAHAFVVRALSGAGSYSLSVGVTPEPEEAGDCGLGDAGESPATALNITKLVPLVECVASLGAGDVADWFVFWIGDDGTPEDLRVNVPLFLQVGDLAFQGVDVCVTDPEGGSLGCGGSSTGTLPILQRCVRTRGEFLFQVVPTGAGGTYDLTFANASFTDPLGSMQLLCGEAAAGNPAGNESLGTCQQVRDDDDGSELVEDGTVQGADEPVEPKPAEDRHGASGCIGPSAEVAGETVAIPGGGDGAWFTLAASKDLEGFEASIEALSGGEFTTYFHEDDDGHPGGHVKTCGPGPCSVPVTAHYAYVQSDSGTLPQFFLRATFQNTAVSLPPPPPLSIGEITRGGGAGCGPTNGLGTFTIVNAAVTADIAGCIRPG
ncbi:MAG TPA: hypothetical protein VI997_09560 [Candidatus Thermoplasmatota archaeon]|nr:hypothetical protein [Candidatus Thermoplasmatota archaeon]